MWYYIGTVWLSCFASILIIRLVMKFKVIEVKEYYVYMILLDTVLLSIVPFIFTGNMYIENIIFTILTMSLLNFGVCKAYIRLNTKKEGMINLKMAKTKNCR